MQTRACLGRPRSYFAFTFFSSELALLKLFLSSSRSFVRQTVSLTKIQRRAANAYLFLVAVVLPGMVVLALYLPMLKFMWKAHALR